MTTSKKVSTQMGNFVLVARCHKGWTQKHLEKQSKVRQSSIARAENNGCSISLAEKLLKAMGYTLTFKHVGWSDGTGEYISFIGN